MVDIAGDDCGFGCRSCCCCCYYLDSVLLVERYYYDNGDDFEDHVDANLLGLGHGVSLLELEEGRTCYAFHKMDYYYCSRISDARVKVEMLVVYDVVAEVRVDLVTN